MIFQEGSISETIYRLSILQQTFIAEKLKTLQLNSIQARSLSYIYVYPGTIQRELAHYLGKQQATVTNVLKGLEERKLVYREIPKSNERQKNIFLTKEGEHLVTQVNQLFEQLDEKVRKSLTKEEQNKIQGTLDKIEKDLS
ncbi:MarR family winged helix-turn-helix transcriptional regulator [Enterococcus termitis]|uniref:MarR family winged helix-turn-helix transcriptional regulator n=1 Tax=Enterococcus termitis TaxID=332950 RepID=UPI000917CDDB|nr:MarR family transcriptional regulator [Enterococcus termitis]OJG98079.1 hypothetical protein RV18_GL003775 [Enterococcus termitis]